MPDNPEANPTMTAKVPEASMSNYISDMKAVNNDGDGTIEEAEFKRACAGGMIKTSASGVGGSDSAAGKPEPKETSDRTPDKASPTPLEQKDTGAGGGTSDRTPDKSK